MILKYSYCGIYILLYSQLNKGDRLLNKIHGFKSKQMTLIAIIVTIVIGVTFIILLYNQRQNDKKEQTVIIQQKANNVKIENQKQEEVEQKKLVEDKALADQKKLAEDKALKEKKALSEQKKIEEQKALEKQKKADEEEKAQKEANAVSASGESNTNGALTKEEKASEMVRKIIINKTPKVKVEYDHIQNRGGKNYYVVRAYDDMGDHISTLGWYYVQVDTGKAFEWDLIADTLTPIN